VIHKHLRLVYQPPKRRGVNNAIAIALKFTTKSWWRLFIRSTSRVTVVRGVKGKIGQFGHYGAG
jgi:hypothetical protein